MLKPQNYDQIVVGFNPITPGGHRCVIKKVEEMVSQSGLAMLKVSFDTDQTDQQPEYFTKLFFSDRERQRPDNPASWKGKQYVVTDQRNEYGTKNLKSFCCAVEESNPGFITSWGDGWGNQFANKRVGIVFREEEYQKADGSTGVSTKAFYFCGYETATEQRIPSRKMLKNETGVSFDSIPPEEWVRNHYDPLTDNGIPFH